MTEGEFPFRSFTMRAEGYDRDEVDSYVETLRNEITESRRALETATHRSDSDGDARLHDPEGAVTRTLAIAQETADRVLHDAQVEADRRRSEADEHASTTIAEADERAARLLSDMETQAAEVREQGVVAARSAIQVERDKAMAELAHVRRVRDDLRTEAVDLKSALDTYRSQAREGADTLAAAASGPLLSADLPDFIDDDVVLAGIVSAPDSFASVDTDTTHLQSVDADQGDAEFNDEPQPVFAEDLDSEITPDTHDVHEAPDEDFTDDDSAEQEHIDAPDFSADLASVEDLEQEASEEAEDETLAEVISIGDQHSDDGDAEIETESSGTFLSEVRAAAEDDDMVIAPEAGDSDRFLSELRGLADDDDGLDSEAADRFFDDD